MPVQRMFCTVNAMSALIRPDDDGEATLSCSIHNNCGTTPQVMGSCYTTYVKAMMWCCTIGVEGISEHYML